jgi:hypothetical protein
MGKGFARCLCQPKSQYIRENFFYQWEGILAMVWGMKHFRSFLYGRKFKIATDYKPLPWIVNIKDPHSRLQRWRIKLEKYDYEIIQKGVIKHKCRRVERGKRNCCGKWTAFTLRNKWQFKKAKSYEYRNAPLRDFEVWTKPAVQ